MSFPGVMQGDKGNIKVNLGITFVKRLAGFYRGISVFCLYTDTALYNNTFRNSRPDPTFKCTKTMDISVCTETAISI